MKYGLVVIGASQGGLQALRVILPALPAGFCLPLVVVQHRSPAAGDTLQVVLQQACALQVQEIKDKQAIAPGIVQLAPPDYHLLVEDEHFALSLEAPVHYARPAIDLLFETAARCYGPRLVGVVLTGTGDDGAQGLAAIQRHGGLTLIESPQTAQAAAMPTAAMAATIGATELELARIGPYLVDLSLQ